MKVITRKEAIKQGAKQFYTGKPCKHGHVGHRLVSNYGCLECIKIRNNNDLKSKYANDVEFRERSKKYQVARRENNPEHYSQLTKNRLGNNEDYKTKQKQRSKKHYTENKQAYVIVSKQYHQKRYQDDNVYRQYMLNNSRKYRRDNPGWASSVNAKRRAQQLQATVGWANEQNIRMIYNESKRISAETGIIYHVDHIIPLQSKIVCGLHCEDNLQIITATENLTKSNKFKGE